MLPLMEQTPRRRWRGPLTLAVVAVTATAVLALTLDDSSSVSRAASTPASTSVCGQVQAALQTAENNGGTVQAADLLPAGASSQERAALAGLTFSTSKVTTSSGVYKNEQDAAEAASVKNGQLSAAQTKAAEADISRVAEQATACGNQLHAETATYGYLAAAMISLAAEAVVFAFAAGTICAFTGPVGCLWGVRFAEFLGGFVDALVFQYAYEGYINTSSVVAAFVDGFVQLVLFSHMSAAEEKLVELGTRGVLKDFLTEIKGFITRYASMAGLMDDAASVMTNIAGQSIFANAAATGRGGVELVDTPTPGSGSTAGPLWLTPIDNVGDQNTSGIDVSEGGNYQWVAEEQASTDRYGDIGYKLSQGSKCLTNDGNNTAAKMAACSPSGSVRARQTWYQNGSELISSTGGCLDSGYTSSSCDSETTTANYYNTDLLTLNGVKGNWMPLNTVADWSAHWAANLEPRW